MTIDWKKQYINILRGLAIAFPDRADVINKVIAGIESGRNVDAHMAAVAVAVASNDPNDWAGVTARIEEHGAEFQRPRGGG